MSDRSTPEGILDDAVQARVFVDLVLSLPPTAETWQIRKKACETLPNERYDVFCAWLRWLVEPSDFPTHEALIDRWQRYSVDDDDEIRYVALLLRARGDLVGCHDCGDAACAARAAEAAVDPALRKWMTGRDRVPAATHDRATRRLDHALARVLDHLVDKTYSEG